MKNYNSEVKKALQVIKEQCINNIPPEGDCSQCALYGYCGTDPHTWDIKIADLRLNCPHTKHCSAVVIAETEKGEAVRKLKRKVTDYEILRVERDFLENTLNTLCPDWKLKIVKDKGNV